MRINGTAERRSLSALCGGQAALVISTPGGLSAIQKGLEIVRWWSIILNYGGAPARRAMPDAFPIGGDTTMVLDTKPTSMEWR